MWFRIALLVLLSVSLWLFYIKGQNGRYTLTEGVLLDTRTGVRYQGVQCAHDERKTPGCSSHGGLLVRPGPLPPPRGMRAPGFAKTGPEGSRPITPAAKNISLDLLNGFLFNFGDVLLSFDNQRI